MSSRSSSTSEKRKSTSFLSKLRPPSLIISKRSQNYDVESHNYVNDPVGLSGEDQRGVSGGFSLRRDSISLSSVISTLLRKSDKSSSSLRRSRPHSPDDHSSIGGSSLGLGKKSERSKSFNIKCDKSSESISSEMIPKKVLKTSSFSVNGGISSDYGTTFNGRNRKKVQRSVSSVSELIAPLIPKSDDIVSTRPEGGYEDTSSQRPSSSSWLDEAMPSILSERLSTPSKKSLLNSSCSTLSSSSFSTISPPSSNSSKKTEQHQQINAPSSSSPGLSRTQELEDYAKQYEDLYSKRILSNRSARVNAMGSTASSPSKHYSSMSLPRKLPPVKTLVCAFNDQINQQRLKQESRRLRLRGEEALNAEAPQRRNVYGTLPKKTKSSASFFNDENSSSSSIQFSTLRKYSSRKSSSKSGGEDSNYVILEKDETPGEENLHGEEVLKGRVPSSDLSFPTSSKAPNHQLKGEEGIQGGQSLSQNCEDVIPLPCDMNASELESWRRRQEVERLRVLKLGDSCTPPKLPPKKPHLRSKGTFLLETDFDEIPVLPLSHSTSFKKPPAPSPPSTPNNSSSTDWDPRSTSTPENDDYSTRAYHKDSFMAHRRDYCEQESLYKMESSSEVGADKYKSRIGPPIQLDERRHEFKHSESAQGALYPEGEKPPPSSELELSNLSLLSNWEKNNQVSNPQSSSSESMRFTSDVVKGFRASSGRGNPGKLASPPPPVAPKPYNRSLSERLPTHETSKYNPGGPPTLSSSSFNVSNNPGAPVLSSSSSNYIHSSKSTPSLNCSEPQVLLARKFSQHQPENIHSNNRLSQQSASEIIPSSSFQKWKRSMDSLDTNASSVLSSGNNNPSRASRSSNLPPPPNEIRTSKSGTLAPSSHMVLDSLPDKCSVVSHQRATSLDHHHTTQVSPPKHFHSNSDSGLSSLGGRTSTMSPVSTISSVSSGSSGSSRASLRSASIVSSSTLPGEAVNLIEEEEGDSIKDILSFGSHSSPTSRHLFHAQTGILKNKIRTTFQEEIDCEKVFQRLLRALESLSSSEKPCIDGLQTLFYTSPYQKTLLDYVDGILELESNELFHSLERSKMKKNDSSLDMNSKAIKSSFGMNASKSVSAHSSILSSEGPSSLPTFLHGSNSGLEFEALKGELLQKVDQKLSVLRSAQVSLKEEVHQNEELGKSIAEEVKRLVRPCEYDKFDLHIQEMDKITNLLLGLSGRLARVENNLLALSIDGNRSDEIYRVRSEEGKLLLAKKDKLADQLVEAKKLKQNIDRRSNLVAKILRKNVSDEFFSEYIQYIKNKTRLILDSREIYDKIKLGEEQVYALKTSST